MKPRCDQPHSLDTPGQRGSETALTVPNAEAAALLRSPSFREAATHLYGVSPLQDGTVRFGKSAIFFAALDGLAWNIEREGMSSLSFTYGEWATIGNTWGSDGARRRKKTSTEGAGSAFRAWQVVGGPAIGSGRLRVRLIFTTSAAHGGRNTPGTASITAHFRNAQGKDVFPEKQDTSKDYARVELLGKDNVLDAQAGAMVEYARSSKLERLFTWPTDTPETDYRVDVLPSAEIQHRRSSRQLTVASALLLPILPMLFGGWYLKERQTLKDLVKPGPRALLQTEAVCRSGVPAVRVQVVLGVVVSTVHLIRREAGSTGSYDLVHSFHLGKDFNITATLNADREAPNIRFSKAIDYTDGAVQAGHTYEYNLAVQSSLGEMFPFYRGGPPTAVSPCP
jgi:hypothetical protein